MDWTTIYEPLVVGKIIQDYSNGKVYARSGFRGEGPEVYVYHYIEYRKNMIPPEVKTQLARLYRHFSYEGATK